MTARTRRLRRLHRLRGLAVALAASVLVVACSDGAPPRPQASPAAAPTPSPPSAPASPSDDAGTPAGSPTVSPGSPDGVSKDPPNILVVEADDMRADDLRWMPRTARMVGGSGLDFRNSFAPNPLCCPARATFLTGQHSHNHQVLSHVEPYGFGAFDDSDTLATRLQAAGYRTALVGKYLNGYGVQPTVTGESSLLYVPPGWTEWWAGSDAPPGGGGTYDYFGLVSNVNGELHGWPGEYSTHVTGRQTRDLVERFAADQEPWFLWWTPVAPHHGTPVEPDDPGTVLRSDGYPVTWVTPARPDWVRGRFDDRIDRPPGLLRPGGPREAIGRKPWYLRHLPALSEVEQAALVTVARQRAESLHVLDREVAATLRHLRRVGEADRTVVVFTSDNGYYLGEHRKRQGKINLHEPSVRVPLLMAGPGVPTGARYDPVAKVDLTATLAGLAGVRLRDPDGRDLRPLLRDGDRGWRQGVLVEGLMPEPAYRLRAGWAPALNTVGVRTARWKYVRYATGEVELYDLEADPLELVNVAGRADLRAVERTLRREWLRLSRCAGEACRSPLPAGLQVDSVGNRRTTEAQAREVRRRYG